MAGTGLKIVPTHGYTSHISLEDPVLPRDMQMKMDAPWTLEVGGRPVVVPEVRSPRMVGGIPMSHRERGWIPPDVQARVGLADRFLRAGKSASSTDVRTLGAQIQAD